MRSAAASARARTGSLAMSKPIAARFCARGSIILLITRSGPSPALITRSSGICIAAGYSVGRTGCWAVGDDYGRPWNGPLAVAFPEGAPPSTVRNMQALFGIQPPPGTNPDTVLSVHPTQLYETVLGFVMFAILWRYRDHKHAEGWLFGLYLVLAGLERFLIEFLRAKDDRFFGPLTAAQVIGLALAALGIVWMQMRKDVGPGKPGIHAKLATARAA